MKYQTNTIGRKDITTLNIGDMVKAINEDKISINDIPGSKDSDHTKKETSEVAKQELPTPVSADIPSPSEEQVAGSDWWTTFMNCCDHYKTEKVNSTKGYAIDPVITDTLKICKINRASTGALINAILRSFIEVNMNRLRSYVVKPKTLIQ